MQNTSQTNFAKVQNLPPQAAPINRAMMSSALAGESGVQPSDALHYMLAGALILALL